MLGIPNLATHTTFESSEMEIVMFGWFSKKQTQADLDAEAKQIYVQCVEVFKRTWAELNPRAATAEQLAFEIEQFSADAFRFMYTKFPLTKHAPASLLWMAVFTAVLECRTHPTDQVNNAIDLLRAKYVN
jgi:hypothetical protein